MTVLEVMETNWLRVGIKNGQSGRKTDEQGWNQYVTKMNDVIGLGPLKAQKIMVKS